MTPWTLDDGRTIQLLTPDELSQLPPGTTLVSIKGEKFIVGTDHIDGDTRFGHLSYGVMSDPSGSSCNEPSMTTERLAKARKLVEALCEEHDGVDKNDDHAWRRCRPCLARAELDGNAEARQLLRDWVTAIEGQLAALREERDALDRIQRKNADAAATWAGLALKAEEQLAAAQQVHGDLREALATLHEKFDTLLIAEVNAYGGIPVYAGRCGRETRELREAIAVLLEAALAVTLPDGQKG